MGKTESNLLKFFYKNEEELINLESFTIEDIKDFYLIQTESKFKEVKRTELDLDFSQFRSYFQNLLFDLKNTIFLTQNSENQKIKVICKSLSILRDRIDVEYRHKFSDLINWHKPDPLNKLLYNNSIKGFKPPNWVINNSEPQTAKKTPLWHIVFNDILKGKIIITEKDKTKLECFYEENEFDNPTNLGHHIEKIYSQKKDTLRTILTETIAETKSPKNIFSRNKKNKIMDLIKDSEEDKMCDYFKEKYNNLFSTDLKKS